MSEILVRNLKPETMERLKARAKRHGRSLQGEVRLVLEQAAGFTQSEAVAAARRWHDVLAGQRFTDSATLIRRDRQR